MATGRSLILITNVGGYAVCRQCNPNGERDDKSDRKKE